MINHLRPVAALGIFGIGCGIFFLSASAAPGGVERSQTIHLAKGWNAVFIEVEPGQPAPQAVFKDSPVDVVAAFYQSNSSLQYVSDPSLAHFKKTGWGVWYAPARPDAFLSTLFAIEGQRAYLIHATGPAPLTIKGSVVVAPIEWRPDLYNLVGFNLVAQGGPTFARFFAGSRAHESSKIYRLVDGAWRLVSQPATTAMKAGEAFWIYNKGPSVYQGPLEVNTRATRGLLLKEGAAGLGLNNLSGNPLGLTIEHLPGGPDGVPLAFDVLALEGDEDEGASRVSLPLSDGSWSIALPVLEADSRIGLRFRARREAMTLPFHASLLRITTDLGTVSWVPVAAARDDLNPATP